MPYRLALILLLVGPRAAWGQSRSVTLPLAVGARVQVATLSDGFTVGVFVRGMDAAALGRRLAPLKPAHMQLLAPAPKQGLAYLRFGAPVTHAAATQAHHPAGAKKIMAIRIAVEAQSQQAAVWAHAKAAKLPLPASLEADDLRAADTQLMDGHIAQAQLLLEGLKGGYALHAWVLLRLGDVAVGGQDTDRACAYYDEAKNEGLERTASMMAILRARVLGCPHAAEPPWDRLLSRDAIDDPVGQRISDEAAWALGYEAQLPALHRVLALQGKNYARTIDRPLRDALTARALRLDGPLGVAAMGEHPAAYAHHPEAFDLDLAVNGSWCQLGVPESWRRQKASAATWMTLGATERRAWQKKASTCELTALPALHVPAAKPTVLRPVAHLADLQRRLARAQRTAFPPRPPPPAASTAPGEGAVAEADGAPAEPPGKEQP